MDVHFTADPSAFAPVLTLAKIVIGLVVLAVADMAFEIYWVSRKDRR